MEGEEAISSSIVGSRLGKAATAAAFVATGKPGAGRAGTPSGPERSGGRRSPTLLLRAAKAEGRRKRVGLRRCGHGPFRAPVAPSKKAGARPPPRWPGARLNRGPLVPLIVIRIDLS